MPIRRAALFLISMAVPSLLVLALGARMIAQQGELHAKHLEDERRLLSTEFERALRNRVDMARHQANQPFVALVATLRDRRLLLPWERAVTPDSADPPFEAAVAEAEREEFADRLDRAAAGIQRALRVARTPRQASHAKLLQARILVKSRRPKEATEIYRLLVREPREVLDHHGVPYALYAAERLFQTGTASGDVRGEIASALDRAVSNSERLSPVGWYLARSVAEALARGPEGGTGIDHRQTIAARIADAEHALALQRELPSMLSVWRGSPTAWLPQGSPAWLVGLGEPTGEPTIIAVRAESIVAAIHADVPRLASHTLTTLADAGEWLGPQFPGLKVSVAAEPPDNRDELWLQRAFYGSALVVVLGVTMFGAYLLWRDMNRELKLAALRSQFVASVSHELKTPLTAIRMFAETLREGRGHPATRDEYLDTIVNESERLTRLLNNVLDFSKIEQGRKAYRLERRSLSEIVAVAARAMAYPLEQHGFTLRLAIDDSLPPANVDADALEQAILNLLTNAMKYSGGGRTIDLRLSRDSHQAIIAVRDAGIGIPLHEHRRIFEKFHRVPTPENQRIPGTGLGLALVDHIVTAHGGSVQVESAPGQGSTFSILLPLAGASS